LGRCGADVRSFAGRTVRDHFDIGPWGARHRIGIGILLGRFAFAFVCQGETHVQRIRRQIEAVGLDGLAVELRELGGELPEVDAAPGPKNSTNLPTTFSPRRIAVTYSTRSVAVTPSRNLPVSSKPTTSGVSM